MEYHNCDVSSFFHIMNSPDESIDFVHVGYAFPSFRLSCTEKYSVFSPTIPGCYATGASYITVKRTASHCVESPDALPIDFKYYSIAIMVAVSIALS